MSEKIRGGWQEDGTYVQQISRLTERNGVRGKFPPKIGQSIITRSGAFVVKGIVEIITIGPRVLFRTVGKLKNRD